MSLDDTKPKRGGVTPIRLFSGKLSGSRNTNPSPYAGRSIDATSCHWCRVPFKNSQMRYPILDYTTAGCDTLASVCLECFKETPSDSHDPAAIQEAVYAEREASRISFNAHFQCDVPPPKRPQPIAPRQESTCPGCGEPIFVSPDLRWRLQFCSVRCYQRVYRKRRRGTESAVDWKQGMLRKCACCKKPLKSKRQDVKFCSNKCRQWQYRRRRAS